MLLSPTLESLVMLRGRFIEQRAAEARDVTAQMQTGARRPWPRFAESFAGEVRHDIILSGHLASAIPPSKCR